MTIRVKHYLALLFLSFFVCLNAYAEDKEQGFSASKTAHINASASYALFVSKTGPQRLNEEASLNLPENYIFIPQKEAKELLEALGNEIDDNFIGMVTTRSLDWMITIDYIDSGYISDNEAENLDADQLLSQLKEGMEESNKYRKEKGFPLFHVVNWLQSPKYDKSTHHLVWAIIEKNDGNKLEGVNYNTYLLGRKGYFEFNLLDGREDIEKDKVHADTIANAIDFQKGHSYGDYIKGKDKAAGFGLTALILGTVVAKKLGLLTVIGVFLLKISKFIVLGLALFWKKIKALLGFKKK